MMISRRTCFLLFLLFISIQVFSQGGGELPPGYYITIGAYDPGMKDYAKRYVDKIRSEELNADYGFNTSHNYYYVYLEYFDDLRESINRMLAIRKEGRFTDAWVRVVSGVIAVKQTEPSAEAATTETAAKISEEVTVANETTTSNKEEATNSTAVVADSIETVPEPEEEIIQHERMTLGNTEVFLSLFNAANNRVVEGKVQAIDLDREKLIKEVPGNDYLILNDPNSKSGIIRLVADAFGYRKIEHDIHYDNPLQDTTKSYVELMGTTFVVFFDLVRYHKGDIRALYNVYFYNDAAMMMRDSKYELNLLLAMLQDNENFRIMLHGHTNGNYHGRILSVGPEGDLFSINGAKNTVGSAKDLSRQRAETIKRWLMENGINGDRIEIKAWGGKRPIYDKRGVNARRNVRVEVEVLQE